MKIKLKIIWCKICEKFWGYIANISWKLANLFKPKKQSTKKIKTKKILRAIWKATIMLIVSIIFGVVIGAISGLVIVGLATLLGKTMAIIISCLIAFVGLVIGIYKRDN